MRDVALSGWATKPLGEIAENLDSKRVPITKAKREAGDIPYYGASGLVDHVRDYLFDEPLLLVSEDGANLLARTYPIAFSVSSKIWVNNHAHVLRFTEAITRRFVELYLNSISLAPYVSGMAQPKLNQKKLSGIPVPFPPLEEQQRIVAVLDEAFEGLARACAHAEANLQNARELYGRCRDGLLEHGHVWEELQLDDLLENITYGFTNPMPNADEGPFKITAKNVIGGRIDYKNARRTTVQAFTELLTDKSRPKIGDVLLTKDGTLGRTAVVDQGNICINQSVAVMRVNSRILPDYLAELLACSVHQEAMVAGAGGTTIKHLYITRVPKITLEIPEIPEQIKLLEALAAMRFRCGSVEDAATAKIQDLEDLRQALLQKAFAGELT